MVGVPTAACFLQPVNVRVASLPQAIILFVIGSQLLLLGLCRRAPFQLSSTPRGAEMVPGVFIIVEDFVAVDGGGGREYRQALVNRFGASGRFRRLMWQMNWFWGVGAVGAAAVTSAVVVLVQDLNIAFAFGKLSSISR